MNPASLTCNGVCIEATSESKHMQLIHLGNLLQKLFAVRPETCVQHGLTSAQLEMKNPLGDRKKHGAENQEKFGTWDGQECASL